MRAPARFLHDWQRFPAAPVLAGWLRPTAPGKPARLPHGSVSTLLALYAQLFTNNLQYDATMQGGVFELDQVTLADATGRTRDRIETTLDILRRRRFLRIAKGAVSMLDPVSGDWPPLPFAMLPARYVVGRLPEVRKAAAFHDVKVGDALALYLVLVVQRNRATEEIWFSKEKSAALAGVSESTAMSCLSALLRAGLAVRSGLSAYKYMLLGFEATDEAK